MGCRHKVRTYKEYHSVCPSSELGLSQPLSRQRVFPSPQKQGGGGTLACGWGVGGSPNSDEGRTLWYSLYVRTLWLSPSQKVIGVTVFSFYSKNLRIENNHFYVGIHNICKNLRVLLTYSYLLHNKVRASANPMRNNTYSGISRVFPPFLQI
jgi:hypothetical protein